MDIGTAKPEKELLDRAPHRLIDIIDPSESYSVAQFHEDALREMNEISARGRIPLLVGGTMMYYKVLQNGIASLPCADERVRAVISADAESHGWPYIHQQLAEVDPESAARLKPTDSQRLQRALEVYRVTGKTLTQFWAEQQSQPDSNSLAPAPYEFINLSIAPGDRSVLHQRIAQRFDIMLKGGFIEEVEQFYQSGELSLDMPSMRCVGYRQVWEYLDGSLTKDDMRERGIIATRQLAKRQLTWLRSWPNLSQLETNDTKVLDKALEIIENAS
jgi:tRNA dimethylallyltransferase